MPRPSTTLQQLLQTLRRQVSQGYRPGELLPSQRVLAEMHGTGHATVNRALTRLAREGLVRAHARSGWRRAGKVQKAVHGRRRRLERLGLITRRSDLELQQPFMRFYRALAEEGLRRGIEWVIHSNPRRHHPTPARSRLEWARVPWNAFDMGVLAEITDAQNLSDPLLRAHRVLVLDQDARVFGLSSVAFDDEAAGRAAAAHLMDLGHRRFAVTDEVSDPGWPCEPTWLARLQGFEHHVRRWGGILHPDWRVPAGKHRYFESHEAAGRRLARAWAKAPPARRPTALFALDTGPLPALIDEWRRHGFQVPRDLSIVLASWHPPARLLARARSRQAAAPSRPHPDEFREFTTVYLDLDRLVRRLFEAAQELWEQRSSAASAPGIWLAPPLVVPGVTTGNPPR